MTNINLTNLNKTQGFKVFHPNGQYHSIAAQIIGDINGDGYDDIVINDCGASLFNIPSSNYIIFGKSRFSGDINLSNFNNSYGLIQSQGFVSGIGDINGDQYDDIVISSGTNRYVVFGKFDIRSVNLTTFTSGDNGFKIQGLSDFNDFFSAINSAGDVNGDGFNDIIIGDSFADFNSRTDSGAAYVIFGKSNDFSAIDLASFSSGVNGFVIQGAKAEDWLGIAVNSAGDINRDGYDDIIIGAFGADPSSRDRAGAAYVIYGKASGFNTIDLASFSSGVNGFIIRGAVAGDWLGYSVKSAGDINGDGFSDLLIGSYGNKCYIIYGKISTFTTLDLLYLTDDKGIKIQGNNEFDRIGGNAIAGLQDINGDKIDDIIIGTQKYIKDSTYERMSTGEGTAYIIYGKEVLSGSIIFPDKVDVTFEGSGILVSGQGDINGDSYNDFIVLSDDLQEGIYIMFGADMCSGDKQQIGTEGNDDFLGNKCAFIYDGKGGTNSVSYQNSKEWILADLETGKGQNGYADGDEYINIHDITGSSYSDILRGSNLDNNLIGLAGNDDIEDIGGGNDVFTGGEGDDQFIISRARGSVTITDFKNGNDKVNLINFPEIGKFQDVLSKVTYSSSDSVIKLLSEKKVILQNTNRDELMESDFLLSVDPNLSALETITSSFWADEGGKELFWATFSPIITTVILGGLGWGWKKGIFCCGNLKTLIMAKFATDVVQKTKIVNAEIITAEKSHLVQSHVEEKFNNSEADYFCYFIPEATANDFMEG